jgi:hypothetical protein
MPVKKVKAIEEREKKPFAVIVKEAYAMHGNQKKAAEAIGISPSRLSGLLREMGLREWTVVIPDMNDQQAALLDLVVTMFAVRAPID